MIHALSFALMCTLALTCAAFRDAGAQASRPREQRESPTYDFLNHNLVRPVTRVLDPARWARRIAGRPREAANVDERDEVRLPNTWWQPRLGYRPLAPEALAAWRTHPGPAGRWTVTRGKSEGASPGFQMKDANGDLFFVKLDMPEQAEMSTGAEVVSSLLFWAAGYNVPENFIAHFHPDSLEIAADATYKDGRGREHRLTRAHLDAVLATVARRADGRCRAVASLALAGKPLGPFRYWGRRHDDPEDLVPHELRRELRGLWVVAAWTNHLDSRGLNTLDTWVTEHGRSFVRHHLIDFGATLGSAGKRSRVPDAGTEYVIDPQVMGRSLITLGLVPFRWEHAVDPGLPSVGFIDAAAFDPGNWKPNYPNPAFDDRTLRDIRWGARIVAAFTDEHIRAAVSEGRYSDPRATEYLTRVLIQRRDLIVRRWLPAL